MDNGELINEFISANMTDNTDFKIKLGEHDWSELEKLKSGYFRALCDGDWLEGKERVLVLKEASPWSIARTLQHIYQGSYQPKPSIVGSESIVNSMNLLDLVKTQDRDEVMAEARRSKRQVHLSMLQLADYFDVTSLKVNAATELVNMLQRRHFRRCPAQLKTISAPEHFMRDCCEVYEQLKAHFHESAAMESLETTMAKILGRYKNILAKGGETGNLPFRIVGKVGCEGHESNEVWSNKIRAYICQNGSFAIKLIESLGDHCKSFHKNFAPMKKRIGPILNQEPISRH